jgi:DNA-binding transcriptional regulator LsrR (DeoR family)
MPPPERFTAQQKADMALAWLTPMTSGLPHMTYAELTAKFGQADDDNTEASSKTIQKALIDAFRLGLVKVQKHDVVTPYDRNAALERALRETFDIKDAAVVASNESDTDYLHHQLGHCLATEITQSRFPLFRAGDIIGMGSGRGPQYTVRELVSQGAPLSVQSIILMSLTGSFFALTKSDADFNLDADTQVARLARYFRDGEIISRPLPYPIAQTPADSGRLLKKGWLDRDKFFGQPPDHAILAAGTLLDHRLCRAISRGDPSDPFLKPIYREMSSLISSTKAAMDAYDIYCPVGDVCNIFFFIPPIGVPSDKVSKIEEELRPKIRDVNDRLLTISEEHINSVRNVILVAGGKRKAPTLHYLLTQRFIKIDVLCTDQHVATAVLEMARASI